MPRIREWRYALKRTIREWRPDEMTYVIKEYNAGTSAQAIAKGLNRTLGSVQNKIDRLGDDNFIERGGVYLKSGRGNNTPTSQPEIPDVEPHIRVYGNTMVFADVHCPYYDKKVLEMGIKIAKKFGVKQVICNGDFLNLDAFSKWEMGCGREDLMKELKVAENLLNELLKQFNKVFILLGNHENRLRSPMMGKIPFTKFFKIIKDDKRIITSDHYYCIVNDNTIVGHPRTYSERGGQVPADICDAYEMNCIGSHGHQWGIQMNKSGRFVGVDGGIVCDPKKIDYYQRNLSKNRRWQQGFSMIYNKHIHAFSMRFTDFDLWLKMKV